MSVAPSYAAVFTTPYATRTFGSALFGRLSYGMVSLSLMLAITDSTGSYAVAGGVMSVFGGAVFLLSPARAGLVDRHGPRRTLPVMALLYGLLLAAMSVSTWHKDSSPLFLGVLAIAAGGCAPPLGPTMRMVWSVMLPDKGLLQRAYSLDTVAEELLFISGPLLAGVMMVVSGPSLGVAVSAVLVLTGTLVFVTSPVVRAVAPRAAGAEPSARGSLVRQPMIVAVALGLCLGAVALLMVAAANRHHHPTAVVWGEAGFAAGSAIGGLVYGAITWKVQARVRLPVLACVLGLLMAGAGLMPELWSLFAAVGFAGLFLSPALATAYLVADERVEPEHRTKAGAWVNTALNAGVSIGSAVAGLLVSELPLEACFALVSLPAVLCVATLYSGTAYPGTEGQRTVITTEASSARQE